MARRKAGNFQVVAKQRRRRGHLVVLRLEELPLVVVARPPVQHGSNAQRFTEHVTHHVFGPNALRWTFVMAATGGVDVVVARIPSERWRIDPSSKRELEGC